MRLFDHNAGVLIANRYRIVSSAGGVHQAIDELSGARVIVKTLSGNADDKANRARFEREFRATRKLVGRHVARVLDAGEYDGTPFIVLELFEGVDLARELKSRGRLAVAEAADVMLQVACGLAEAHAHGIVHRDVKPANLFLAEERGERVVKVIDFGIAKFAELEEDDALTQSFATLGTPAYMSPEQIRSPRAVDRPTDVWSFGLVLFRVLAGRLPFAGSATSVPVAICEDPAPALLDVPADLAEVVAAALEKDARLRPTLADLGDVLVEHLPENARVAHDAYTELARLSLADLRR
jgi:serine/threonine-protein kinase